jgi:hypothetical protein
MKLTILLLSVSIAFLSSCTTAYKSGQTPDDVYYSPAQDREEYVNTEKEEDDEYRYNDEYYEDRYLRMKVRNRTRWSDLDDWYYSDYRNRYNVYLGCCFCQNTWSPYSYWNTYHNPYYNNYVIVKDVRTPVYNKPRTFNLNAYNPAQSNTRSFSNTKINQSTNTNTYTPRNNNNNNGNRLRDVFRSSNSSNTSSSSSSNNSSSTQSSGSKPSSSSSSGSSAPVRRF